MRSTHVHALATLMTALPLLVATPGCKFDPVGAVPPGDGSTPPPPVDGNPPPPTDGRPVTPIDGSTPIDGPPVIEIDARGNPQRRKEIRIRASEVEAPGGSGSLSDFPVLFAVEDAQLAARASNDGSDIYFTDEAGDALAHEIEKWDPDTGELVAWVKLPQLSETEDTLFYVYYGDPAAAPAPGNPTQVWSNGFAAVWHLAERPGPVVQDGIRDSTSGNDGTAHSSMQANDLVSGQIGDAIDFDGVDDEITFENPITGTGPHTISIWVNQRATTSDDAAVVLGDGQNNRARFLHSVYTQDEVVFGFYSNDATTDRSIIDDGWTLLHWTYDNRDNDFYLDGVRLGGRDLNGVDTRGNGGRLGNADSAFGANMNLNGQLDEVRIATVARPAEWITTEFNNQSDPAGFYTVGPETTPP